MFSKFEKIVMLVIVIMLTCIGAVMYAMGFVPFAPIESSPSQDSTTQQVDAKGGTFTFGDITVVVPKDTVRAEAQLRVSQPQRMVKGQSGPLATHRTSGAQFDVSLLQRNVELQPEKPLQVSIPLRGAFAQPQGDGMRALAYTADGHGGYMLLPATTANGVLAVEMDHLSAKYVTFVSDDELLQDFKSETVKNNPGACSQQVTVGGTKVKFGSASRGWSLDKDSALFACLAKGSDGYVRVNMINRIDYILSVAATSNVRLAATSGSGEAEIIKSFARAIFHPKKVKAYAALDEEVVGSVKVGDLPATIELQGDPHTYLAEAVWRALTVSTAVFIGEDSAKTTKIVSALIESVDVTTCLRDHLTTDSSADWYKAVRAVTDCTGPIIEVLAKHLTSFNLVQRAQAVWDMSVTLAESLVRAGNGIKLQFVNTLRVQVTADYDLGVYVGEWYSHPPNIQMTVRGDGTGERQSEVEVGGDYPVCTAHTALRVTAISGGFRTEYLNSRFSDCPPNMDEVYPTGETVDYVRESNETVIGSNRQMCRESAFSRLNCSLL